MPSVSKENSPAFLTFSYFYSQIKQESAWTPEIWKTVYMKLLNSISLLAPQPVFLEEVMGDKYRDIENFMSGKKINSVDGNIQ